MFFLEPSRTEKIAISVVAAVAIAAVAVLSYLYGGSSSEQSGTVKSHEPSVICTWVKVMTCHNTVILHVTREDGSQAQFRVSPAEASKYPVGSQWP